MDLILDNRREARFVQLCMFASCIAFLGLFYLLSGSAIHAYRVNDMGALTEISLFAFAMLFIAYGSLLYQICLIGYYKRREAYKPATEDELESLYAQKAPSLSVLIPSYKEERKVNWQTMISAALAEYPSKRVVLLIDDPYYATALPDRVKLEDTRLIPQELQALFDVPASYFRKEQQAYVTRNALGLYQWDMELERLAAHYVYIADWLEEVAASFMGHHNFLDLHFADRFFVEQILYHPAQKHRARAKTLREMALSDAIASNEMITRHYARLADMFDVTFSSFERKKYINLSHESNKAMNLNSYISLVGKSWKEVPQANGKWLLQEVLPSEADFTIAHADYINTIDSDSLMLNDYALRMVHLMEQPENKRLAVVQSPCSSFQGCPASLERTAGACIDLQFRTHQGYSYWGASFWVGANAMLRRAALEDIRETRMENGYPVSIFIQDRTVIEDTESSVDLVHKGWKLYNYPVRMTFSANPPDYGSLLIQRRRWSNGGLLILPKLMQYAWKAPKNLNLLKELFMRFHYLASTAIGCVVVMLLLFYPFSDRVSSLWLPMTVMLHIVVQLRDLKNAGYRPSDMLRICAMTLMLFPIIMGGVLKSLQQMVTGKKIPFVRTPKIPGRTTAPALYSMIAVIAPAICLTVTAQHVLAGHWVQAGFSSINTTLLTYALIRFIGIKAAFEDMLAGVRMRWQSRFHNAVVLPIPAVRTSAIPSVAFAKRA
jgi:cellulose synthase (UDP-forming)